MKIMISYSHENKETVKELSSDLKELGHDVWFDESLTGGQIWWDTILKKIRECDFLIFVLSKDSLDSLACKSEYKYASDLKRHVLPVLVDGDISLDLVPYELSKIQFLEYQNKDKHSIFNLIKAIKNLPPVQGLPSTLPVPPEAPISNFDILENQIETLKELSFDEQSALIVKLKGYLEKAESLDTVQNLLKKLRNRNDLYAKIDKEIDMLLINGNYIIKDTSLISNKTEILKKETFFSKRVRYVPHDFFGEEFKGLLTITNEKISFIDNRLIRLSDKSFNLPKEFLKGAKFSLVSVEFFSVDFLINLSNGTLYNFRSSKKNIMLIVEAINKLLLIIEDAYWVVPKKDNL